MRTARAALLCGLLFATIARADETASGVIINARMNTANHSYASARGVATIQLSQPLQGGCLLLYIEASDKGSLAVALAAKSAQASTTVYYNVSLKAPWGDPTICALTAIEMT